MPVSNNNNNKINFNNNNNNNRIYLMLNKWVCWNGRMEKAKMVNSMNKIRSKKNCWIILQFKNNRNQYLK